MSMEIISPDFAIAKYLQKEKACERESLKEKMSALGGELFGKNIIIPFGFTPYGKTLYSETFNREISFLQSCGIIKENHIGNCLVYSITPEAEDMLSTEKISEKAMKELSRAVNAVSEMYLKENEKYIINL